MAMFHVGYDASYMLTDAQLRRYTSYPAWLGAIDLQWEEYNVPFQGQVGEGGAEGVGWHAVLSTFCEGCKGDDLHTPSPCSNLPSPTANPRPS